MMKQMHNHQSSKMMY